ncbi:MAG: hypothetical protein R3F43_21170 [bacterium]
MRTLLVVAALAALAGCSSSVRSVRALRQHGREPAKAEAVVARVEDFRAAVSLIDRLLDGPMPGDPGELARRLSLGDAEAEKLLQAIEKKGLYRDGSLRVPVATLYRQHAEAVIADGGKGTSLLEAVEARFAPGSGLAARWRDLRGARQALAQVRKAQADLVEQRDRLNAKDQAGRDRLTQQIQELAGRAEGLQEKAEAALAAVDTAFQALKFDLRDPEAKALLGDLVAVLGYGARMAAEAAAVVPVVLSQAYGALRNATVNPRGAAVAAGTLLGLVLELRALDGDLALVAEGLYALAERAADAAGVALDETAGFLYENSASDLIGGFALDSFYFDLRAGGEVLFFHNAQRDGGEPKDDAKITYDLTGQKFRLTYDVEPIVFAAASLNLGLDLLRIPGFIQLDFGYKTDRVYKSGGTIERSDDALSALGATGAASDVLALGLAVLGVRAAVERATFNAGTVNLEDAQTDRVVARAPFELKRQKVDLSYDLLWVIDSPNLRSLLDALDLGFRYTTYTVPRIVYEFEDTNGDPEVDNYVLISESDPQNVESKFYQLGILARGAARTSSGFSFPMALGFYLGGGPADFDIGGADEDRQGDTLLDLVIPARLGLAYSFAEPRDRLHFDFELVYDAELIYAFSPDAVSQDENSDLGQKLVDFGGFDVFHGPSGRLRLTW